MSWIDSLYTFVSCEENVVLTVWPNILDVTLGSQKACHFIKIYRDLYLFSKFVSGFYGLCQV